MFTREFNSQHVARSPRLSRADLTSFKAELLRMYNSREISADEYATLTEDVAVIERRARS